MHSGCILTSKCRHVLDSGLKKTTIQGKLQSRPADYDSIPQRGWPGGPQPPPLHHSDCPHHFVSVDPGTFQAARHSLEFLLKQYSRSCRPRPLRSGDQGMESDVAYHGGEKRQGDYIGGFLCQGCHCICPNRQTPAWISVCSVWGIACSSLAWVASASVTRLALVLKGKKAGIPVLRRG